MNIKPDPPVGYIFLLAMSTGVIFYCDDDDDDLMIFLDIIKQIDPELQCITASDCEDALQMLSSGNIAPDLIFLDINMSKMSGIELLAWLKRYQALQNIPIIMYSTSLNKRETDYCNELGASAVIPKLFSLEESIKQIRGTLNTYLPVKQKKD
jgi:CheY-like chemotaxis protein